MTGFNKRQAITIAGKSESTLLTGKKKKKTCQIQKKVHKNRKNRSTSFNRSKLTPGKHATFSKRK